MFAPHVLMAARVPQDGGEQSEAEAIPQGPFHHEMRIEWNCRCPKPEEHSLRTNPFLLCSVDPDVLARDANWRSVYCYGFPSCCLCYLTDSNGRSLVAGWLRPSSAASKVC